MARYISIRIGQGLLVVLGAVAISFILSSVAGDPVSIAIKPLSIPEAEKQRLIEYYGYNRPLLERFVEYMSGVVHGDFGESFRQRVDALSLVLRALPATMYLVVGTIAVTAVVSVPVAVFSVLRRGTRQDAVVRSGLMVLQGLPQFWLGVILVLIFAVQLRWLPSYGDRGLESYVLPIAALSIPMLSLTVRLLRSELLGIMGMEFVTALRAKGLSEWVIVTRHALRNAMPSFVTFFALQIGALIGGTLIVEAVFAWPGIGSLLLSASSTQDLPVIAALVVVSAVVWVLLNLLADLVVLALDPRLRTQS
jgi:ABC-type dipeptide/oligopeptide/nickel transport system permease component